MGNRMLKESIRTSRSVNSLTDFQFRVWIHLITYVDDFGRGSADPELLKGFVFPRRKGVTETTIANALADLATSGMITLYEVDGESFFCFPNWSEHQRIQSRKSKFPAPECGAEVHGDSRKVTVTHGDSPPEIELEIETKEKGKTRARFTPPTVEEVEEYCRSRNNGVNAQKFVDFYSCKGWKVGKNAMKDWKACVRTWEQRNDNPSQPKISTEEYYREHYGGYV